MKSSNTFKIFSGAECVTESPHSSSSCCNLGPQSSVLAEAEAGLTSSISLILTDCLGEFHYYRIHYIYRIMFGGDVSLAICEFFVWILMKPLAASLFCTWKIAKPSEYQPNYRFILVRHYFADGHLFQS